MNHTEQDELSANGPDTLSGVDFHALMDAMPQMVWSTLPDGLHDYYNDRWYEFTGVPHGSTDGEGWNGMFHPDDQDRAWARWRQSLATGEPYEIEYRLRHHSGDYRWTLGRAMPIRGRDDAIIRWIGTCTDIDAAKKISEHNDILSQDLSHRIKNIFAVINALTSLSAREYPEAKAYAAQLRARIGALGKAHEFVRPHSDHSKPDVTYPTVQAMLAALFSPYPAMTEGRVAIEGEDVPIDDRGATPIALIFHELATNAAKHGALSSPNGQVDITMRRDGDTLQFSWKERGGPKVKAPARTGFGTSLVDLSASHQLQGSVKRQWSPEGLEVAIAVPAHQLIRHSHKD